MIKLAHVNYYDFPVIVEDKTEEDVFKPTDPVDMIIPEKEEKKETKKKGRTKKNV